MRLAEITTNLHDRIREAAERGCLGEVEVTRRGCAVPRNWTTNGLGTGQAKSGHSAGSSYDGAHRAGSGAVSVPLRKADRS
jgi:hypothetical protein